MRATVGGTMVSRIMGCSRWGGPLSAYFELTGEPDTTHRNTAMSRGVALEQSVLALWAERSGGGWLPGSVVRCDALPHAHASLDAMGRVGSYHPEDPPPWIVLDAKTSGREEMGADWGTDGSDRLPVEYHLQLLWYLGVCRAAGMRVADEALLPVLVGPEAELQWAARLVTMVGRPLALTDLEGTGLELRTYWVLWDEGLFAMMDERVRRFLREHVEPGIPPLPGDELKERDVRAVARGLKGEAGLCKDFEALQPAEQAVLLDLLEAARQRKAWEKMEEQAVARAQLLLGAVEEVRGLPGGARITWKARQDGVRVFKINEPRRK